MKHLYFIFLLGLVTQLASAETEPNNTSAQASTLTLNSSDSGRIDPAGDVDWWKVTTTADGKLNIKLASSSAKSIRVTLYDFNKSTVLGALSSAGNVTLSKNGLAAGTYYIKVLCDSAADIASYKISNQLELPVQANDAEPNGTTAQAINFTLNSTSTGHIGYYFNKKRDTTDWYKVTTNKDGRLDLNLTPVNGAGTWISLYDNNGTTLLKSKNSSVAFALSADGLAAGTYYIKVNCVDNSKFTPYILKNTLVAAAGASDAEPNDTKAQAGALTLNGSQTGHVGYYYNNKRDTADWYQVTTNKDGRLDLTLTPSTGADTWIYLYDNNGSTLLNSHDSAAAFTLTTDGLAAGTYFIKIRGAGDSTASAYSLKDSLVAASLANDPEPNNNAFHALTLNLNSARTGHVGYYYNNKRDTSDWYKITTKAATKLKLKLSLTNGQAVNVSLYASNGTSLINTSNSTKSFSLITDGLEADLYYIKIDCKASKGFAPYTLTDSTFTPPTTDTLILPLNYRIKDSIESKGDEDWFKVTTNADGKLTFTVTPLTNKYLWIYLYDNAATTILGSKYGASAYDFVKDGLAAGTYYVKVVPYYSTDTLRYLLADTLSVPAQANDVEPNNTKAQALTLPLNGSKTGHVGYYYNHVRDTADWYKITTNADGLLNINLTPANGSYTWIYLYDNDGTKLLGSKYATTPFTLAADGLAAGTYYVRVNCYYNYDFTPYTLSNSLVLPAQANDKEPNNTSAQALALKLNSSTTGHVGYYYNNKRDSADWYKITTTAEGLLNLTLTPANGQYTWVYLYDKDGTTQLGSKYATTRFTLSTDGLAAGTYYVRVNCYYTSDFAPYTLADTLVKPALANDKEPNGTPATALVLNLNDSTTGHLGYFYGDKRDSADWYKITTNADGLLNINLTPANGAFTWIYLYDNNGTTLLNSKYSSNPFTLTTDGLAAGTYYVRVNCYYNYAFTQYKLSNNLVKPALANDAELNNSRGQAVALGINSATTGHVGYYYNNKRDTADWYKITISKDGLLKLNLTPANGSYAYINLYDNNGTTLLHSNYSTVPFVQTTDGLAAGTYYVQVKCYYNYDFTPYTLADSLITYKYAADPEPNKAPYLAKAVAPNSTETGHVNFYYNLEKDAADWWKLNYTGTGLQFTLNLEGNKNGTIPYTWFYVYKDTSASPVYSNYFNTPSNGINLSSLSKGQYYIRINTYYSSDFVAYSFSNFFVPPPTIAAASSQKEAIANVSGSLENDISIYPNPVSSRLHIQVAGAHTSLASVILRDAGGKEVWSKSNLAKISAGGSMDVNVEKLPGGIYFLQMIDASGKGITKKVIITK